MASRGSWSHLIGRRSDSTENQLPGAKWVVMVRQESPHVEGREAAKRAERAQGLPSCMLHPHRRLHLSFRSVVGESKPVQYGWCVDE